MCLFVDEWECKFEGEERPLEVCRVCIKAKKVAKGETKIPVPEDMGETEKETASEVGRDLLTQTSKSGGEKALIPPGTRESGKRLSDEEAGSTERDIKGLVEELKSGSMYLLEDEDKKSAYELSEEISSSGREILFITRKYPPRVQENYDLKSEDILWLSTSNEPSAVAPNELDTLSLKMESFISGGGDFIFIDGVENLFSNNPDSTLIHLFQSIEDQIATSGAALVFAMAPSSIEEKHISLIKNRLDVKKIPLVEKETKKKPAEVPDKPLARDDKALKAEDIEVKKEALKGLDDEFHKGDISVDEYISKRAVLTTPDSSAPNKKIEREER
ncbi:MAG: DUF835 domain-containing protein [Candidatus Thermoplasmatota archaeon]